MLETRRAVVKDKKAAKVLRKMAKDLPKDRDGWFTTYSALVAGADALENNAS